MHRKNKVTEHGDETNRKNIQFAKDLFQSWDVDGDGIISENELVKPLVSLGLAPDHRFARKICMALDPRRNQRTTDDPIELQLDDFLRIFKSDKISDKLMNVLDRETKTRHQRLELVKKQAMLQRNADSH